jgi:hypothetical protein
MTGEEIHEQNTAPIAMLTASTPLYAQTATIKDQLVGTWKVVTLKATSGDKVSYPRGEQPTGYVSLTPTRL